MQCYAMFTGSKRKLNDVVDNENGDDQPSKRAALQVLVMLHTTVLTPIYNVKHSANCSVHGNNSAQAFDTKVILFQNAELSDENSDIEAMLQDFVDAQPDDNE